MDDDFIVTTYVVLEDLCHSYLPPVKYHPKMSPGEIMTVAVVAARCFDNHLERTLLVMSRLGYFAHPLSVSRFNRQLHRQADFLAFCLETLMSLFRRGQAFIIDSHPLPVCKRARARRCRKVRGRPYCGYCAAKKEKFFGWRLHLICTPEGIPVAFHQLPGAFHDLTPIYELTYQLPEDCALYGDKAYNDQVAEQFLLADGLTLVPVRKKNMTPHDLMTEYELKRYRTGIETANSQLESMGIQRLKARTNVGFEIKVHASLIALLHTQLLAN